MSTGGSKPAGNTTVTQNSSPWAGQQPYLQQGFQAASDYFNSDRGTQYFPFSTVTPFSAETEAALGAQTNRAMQGSPVVQSAQNLNQQTTQGGFLGGNPYQDQLVNQITGDVSNAVNSQFAGANRYGSGGHAEALSRGITKGLAGPLFDQFNRERGYQQQASALAPGLANYDYQDISQLGNVGAQREQLGEAQLADLINRFNFDQTNQQQRIGDFMNLIGGNYGQSSTTTQPYFRNRASGALGGALAGNMLGQGSDNPWLWALGGGLLGAA